MGFSRASPRVYLGAQDHRDWDNLNQLSLPPYEPRLSLHHRLFPDRAVRADYHVRVDRYRLSRRPAMMNCTSNRSTARDGGSKRDAMSKFASPPAKSRMPIFFRARCRLFGVLNSLSQLEQFSHLIGESVANVRGMLERVRGLTKFLCHRKHHRLNSNALPKSDCRNTSIDRG